MGTASTPTTRRARALAWLRGRPLGHQLSGLVLAGLALSAPFGGWEPRESKTAQVTAGAEIVTGPLRLTLTSAYASMRPSRGFYVDKVHPGRLLVVRGTIAATGTTPVDTSVLAATLRLPGWSDLRVTPFAQAQAAPWEQAAPQLYYAVDSSPLYAVGPGLVYEAAWVFQEVGPDAPLPETITVEVRGHTLRPSSITRVVEWLDPTPMSTVTLPIRLKAPWQDPNAPTTPTPGATS